MIFEEQSELRKILKDVSLPRFALVRQVFPDDAIKDVPVYLKEKLADPDLASRVRPGMKVVLTGSSRQIANMPVILRELARFVKARGAQPYIIPAMGSHGGATDEGQRELLESYGITEEFCECPIYSSMETVRVGYVGDDEVRMDCFAHDADAIILVGRIKGHTAFAGTYESGMAKMMAIGLGKREGADSLHKYGFGKLAERIPLFARVVFDHCNIIFGVAPIENERDRTCRIEVIKAEDIFDKEPGLLNYAKSRMPRLILPETDVLIVREIGKNISGSGLDANVTGTFATPFKTGGIRKQRVVILDITDESHGNYLGLGNADITCLRAFNKIRTNGCYANMLTSTVLKVGMIPMIMEDDELALKAAVKLMTSGDRSDPRMVYIKNTLSLEQILVSEAHLEEVRRHPAARILEEPRYLNFDEKGNLMDFA